MQRSSTPYAMPIRGLALGCLFAALLPWMAQAQTVSTYTFAQSSGSFTTITGGTQLGSGNLDNQVYTVNLPSSFWFAGGYHSTVYVSANGFITFGTAPAGTNFTPISSTAGYAGAISAFGADLETVGSGTREIRWQEVGSELVFQWRGFKRAITGTESFRFQIRLNTDDGVIRIVYQLDSGPINSTSQQPQVGLRGPSTLFVTHLNNRRVGTGSETWATSLAGSAFNNTMRFTSGSSPKSFTTGQTYTWTPPCVGPKATGNLEATDCVTGTFTVSVDVTSLGDASDVNIVASPGGVLHSGVGVGSYTCGPFTNGTPVTLTVQHNGNANCNASLGSFVNDLTCYTNGMCLVAGASIPDNGCGSNNSVRLGFGFSGLPTSLGSGPLQAILESVDLRIAHSYRGDLRITLTSPAGDTRNLFLRRPSTSASGDNLGNLSLSCPNGVLKLKDGAAALSTLNGNTNNAAVGTFAPEQTLAGFTGDPNGTWILTVCDAANTDVGDVRHVRLNFQTRDCNSVAGGPALPGSACNDGDPCTINDQLDNNCACAGTNVDTDGDGVCDGLDSCPTVVGQVGSPCDDGDDCTINDVLNVSCACVGIFQDTDGDGTCDTDDGCPNDPNKTWEGICGCGNPDVDTDGDTVMDCLDGCPNDPLKIAPGICGCGVSDADSDGDGTVDCNDACPFDPNKQNPGICGCGNAEPGTPCDDGNPLTGNDVITAGCVCQGTAVDCAGVPGGSALPGTPCDDGDPSTVNDIYNAGCGCVGTPTSQMVGLTLDTDANGHQTSWEILPMGGGPAVCSGSGYANNSTVPLACPLPDGCYRLRVMDSFGDGMTTGGYALRDGQGRRIIDNHNDGHDFAFVSELAAGNGFCLPLGNDRLRSDKCDLENLLPSDWIVAVPNPAVSAQFGVGDQTDDGYQFWFFDPDGTYSRRIFHAHATNNYLFPWGPERCAHIRLSTIETNPLPQGTLLNVRVRSRVNGVYAEFGPACRLRVGLPVGCPTPQLVNDLSDPKHSCGIGGVVLNGSQHIWSEYVSAANRYQWEFDDVNSSYLRRISTQGSSLLMSRWASQPLQYGRTYDVRVRVSYDNGATWCPWGAVCQVSTAAAPPAAPQGRAVEANGGIANSELRLWPNPNRGDVLNLVAHGLPVDATEADLYITDLFGRLVYSGQVPLAQGELRHVLLLDSRLATGMYVVSLRSGNAERMQRLVVE